MDVLNVLNTVLWVAGNVELAYTSVMLVVFVVAYFIIFDPRATTGGKLIFQFMLSLMGVLILVFIGIYIDPTDENAWMQMPMTVDWWRPSVRFVIYGFVAYSITQLFVLLVKRKWFPHKLKTASDLTLVQPRHTGEIRIVERRRSYNGSSLE